MLKPLAEVRDPLLFRIFIVAQVVAGGPVLGFGTAIYEVDRPAGERFVFFLVGVLGLGASFRFWWFERVLFFHEHLNVRSLFRTSRFRRAEIVGFCDGGPAWMGGRKLGINFVDGTAQTVPLPGRTARKDRFTPLVQMCEDWLESPESVVSTKRHRCFTLYVGTGEFFRRG